MQILTFLQHSRPLELRARQHLVPAARQPLALEALGYAATEFSKQCHELVSAQSMQHKTRVADIFIPSLQIGGFGAGSSNPFGGASQVSTISHPPVSSPMVMVEIYLSYLGQAIPVRG